jgi:pimeloyl-ACP methyl ester carboxylesterase
MATGAMFAAGKLARAPLATHTTVHDMRERVGRPTMIIHALADPFIPVSHAMQLANISGASYWFTDATRHLGSFSKAPESYCMRTATFFTRALLADFSRRAIPHEAPQQCARLAPVALHGAL